ncbi:ribosome biogenesis/translation initiation ATPase RLI [Candidatus Woesearchaeota archaeon]|nr:ribosome biogenesis/translation initiation ATPase RLI [Candidatus Woesearchaeota archaeon]
MKRIAIVDKDKCNPAGCGNYLCAKLCPINREGTDCIFVGDDKKAKIDEALCIGCGICVHRCPFGAIEIINLPEELKKNPIHRYGQNEFALYSLPTPIFGKVVGILGVNGIGKSTAIKIIAGVLKPNLGNFDSEATFQELVQYFKGTEAQNFFEAVRDGKIVPAYKPQAVDAIPKQFAGTVRELLTKADQKQKLAEMSAALDLTKLLDHNIEHISGGELQRVAIAATALKRANLYIFDEPASYLDIKQRFKVSDLIKSLADENTAVLVIEHDLIILDYVADLVHLMYGKEGVFGVVSLPKTARVGINVFLSGHLKEENIRFRDHEIRFGSKPPDHKEGKAAISAWRDVSKKLGNFTLAAAQGAINQNEIIGVLGENGIGKTSFVKLLAKVMDPDFGVIDEKIVVAYKPQYLQPNEELVMTVLHDAITKYEAQLIKPLNLKGLFTKQLNHLSGGELQRVAIANCLSQKADLYLLDEPSAYLDVEQRLLVSRIIHDIMELRGTSCVIIDHDLLFVDYISKKIMVFDGEPAVRGNVHGPFNMQDGMNKFLTMLNMTFRRDHESNRPRANKPGSQMDRVQKAGKKLYYI